MRIYLGDEEPVEIGLAPLIDCVFLLLIFFLVATTFEKQQKEQQQLPIELPDSSASLSGGGAVSSNLVIGVDQRGNFHLGDQRLSVEDLYDRLEQVANDRPEQQIVIEGDRNTAYQHIVHLLDICQFVGLNHIRLLTRG